MRGSWPDPGGPNQEESMFKGLVRHRAAISALALFGFIAAAGAVGNPSASLFNDPIWQQAEKLVKDGKYTEALPILHGLDLEFPENPDVHNMLGVSYRKLKDYPRSKLHYDRALAIEPNHLPTFEYQGEWFIETGDMASAEKNLAKLKWICGECHEYKDLAEAINKAKAGK
jgi:tetratricopeptide (TPR) repeat protein